ncbi:MAG: DNA-3-methyladenine glycosylase [Pyrinomonadaceae bacterium]
MKVTREFFTRKETLQIAREMLGTILVATNGRGERVAGVIVETEAYLGAIDKASHCYGGRRTPRTEIAYAEGGRVYVYFVYGMYHQFNIVTGPSEHPHAVLIRAVEPLEGIEMIRERRGFMKDENLTSGPGKLCIAFDIDRSWNGEDLIGDRVWLEDHRHFDDAAIESGCRIGVDYAEEFSRKPWRFWVRGNKFVSKK